MNHWWRAYNEAVNDPKLQLLSDMLFRAWFNLMCVASGNDGALPALKDIAFTLRIAPTKAAQILAQLHAAGLLDKTETGFAPHNWSGRQYKSDVSNERVKRYRDKKRNVTPTVTVTPPDTENRKQKTEKKESSLRSDGWPSDFGDQFWKVYPRKTEKLAAMKKLAAVRKSGIVTFEDLIAGAKRYAALGTEPQYTKHPTTWLNAGCWADEPGVVNGQRNSNSRTSRSDAILAAALGEARKIVGDSELAQSADETEFSFGDGSIDRGSKASFVSAVGDQGDYDGGKPRSGSVFEGEIISPDEAYAGLPNNWRVVG